MGETRDWLRRNWQTGVLLALIVALAFFLRVYFSWNEWYPAGFFSGKGDYSGGSDPFYWERAMFYSMHTGKEIAWDNAMNYPLGFPDVRPPLFTWFNLLTGYILSPLFGGVQDASVFMLMINAALMGTLTLIPTYLLGKEAFGKRTGIIAALLLAVSAAALQRSHATIAVHDAWTLFFVVCAFYFYLRALKTMDRKRWVENWFDTKSIQLGLVRFFRENRRSVLYGLLAGMCVAVTALSWQGWAYVPVILVLVYVVELLLDRIRNQDVMGVTILFVLILGTPLLVSFPWYYTRNLIKTWWDVPFYLFAVLLILGIVFSVTRDYPWTLVIPATVVAAAAGLFVGFTVNPSLLYAFVSGAGYFVKNKVYQTIAEAQEPALSEIILNFGWFTYFVGLAAIGWMIWQMPRRNNPAFTMMVFWTVGSLFMAISAARFIFNAAVPFAIATGWALDLILLRMDFTGMRRTFRSLAEGNRRNAFRKAVKVRHVLTILFVVGLVLLPNVWFAVDAAIPFDTKGQYDAQINSELPWFLHAPGYSPSSGTFYLGAFGYSLPKSTDYFPAAWNWLSSQDSNVPLDQRPAFLSWWDYGFEAAERGGHPVVADPFQNGYAIAGQFILSQNESSAIGLMALRVLEGDFHDHYPNFSPASVAVLQRYGLPVSQILGAYLNPVALIPVVLASPNAYGLWDSNLQFYNALYVYLDTILVTHLTEAQMASLYHDLRASTGYDIGYFMVDTRLFPISAQNTGIFYAPAKLSDHRVITLDTGQVIPYDFFQLFANTNQGTHLPVQILPPGAQIQGETIEYQPMFYNSMFYRAYVGYSPTDLGYSSDKGIPGFDQTLQAFAPEPTWNMTHFRLVYRTAYYNPFTDSSNHTGAWQAMSYTNALTLQQRISAGKAVGTVDLSTQSTVSNGLVMLRYYDGAYVNGTVTVGGAPLPHAWITVTDELGTPHDTTTTDANGHYSALVPFGNITVTVSTGTLQNRTQTGTSTLTTVTFPVTLDQALRVNEDLNGDGVQDWLMTRNIQVPAAQVQGTVYFDLNHNGNPDAADAVLAGATLQLREKATGLTVNVTTGPRGTYRVPGLPQGTYRPSVSYRGHTASLNSFTLASSSLTQNLAVPFTSVTGSVVTTANAPVANATVRIADATNGTAWQMTAAAGGTYGLQPLLAGAYTLTATQGARATLPIPVQATAVGTSVALNLTVQPSGWVAGTTSITGAAQPFANLQFQSESNPLQVLTVTSGTSAGYNVSLPAGVWNVNGRVYRDGSLYAYLGQVDVRASATLRLNPSFQPGVRLAGKAGSPGVSAGVRPLIAFLGDSGAWWLHANDTGAYVAFLPEGSYHVEATAQSASTAWAYYGDAAFTVSRSFDIPLWNATLVSGTAYSDSNGNGRVDAGEGVPGARVALADDLGHAVLTVANDTGVFSLIGFSNRTYAGTIAADGFSPLPFGPATLAAIGPDTRYALIPIPVTVQGRVLLNGTVLLNTPVTIHAVPLGVTGRAQSVTSQTDGSYSLTLTPGGYLLLVNQNVTTSDVAQYQNLGSEVVQLAVGDGTVAHDLPLAFRTRVQGNLTLSGQAVSGNVSFEGPDARSLVAAAPGFKIYLQPGTYTIIANRTSGGVTYAVLQTLTLPVAGNVTLALSVAVRVSGRILYNNTLVTTPLNFTLARDGGGSFRVRSAASGTYVAYIVPGSYTVTLNQTWTTTVGGVSSYYRYLFAGTLAISNGTTSLGYDLTLDRILDNTTASGLVTFGGLAANAAVRFIAASRGALNATVASTPGGTYAVGLAPGSYNVYATEALGQGAFLGSLSVPHATALTFDVALAPAYVLSGVTTNPSGFRTAAGLQIQGNATLSVASGGNGAYQVLLPLGAYTVTANLSGTEQGVPVSFAASQDVNLTTDTIANLQLALVVRYGVAVGWDSNQNRTIAAGGSVTYTISVQNTGNVADTYTIKGLTAGWIMTFVPSVVSLPFVGPGNATAVSVTITAPKDAEVNHPAIVVAAISQGDVSLTVTKDVIVGIQRTRALSLQVDATSGTFDGRYLNYTVRVQNRGNAPETVDVSLTNPSDVSAAGWSPALANQTGAPTGTVLRGVTVVANGTTSVRLVLRNRGGSSGVTVILAVQAEDAPGVSAGTTLLAQTPSLSSPSGISVSGPTDTTVLPPNLELISMLVAAVGAVGAGLFLTRKRR